MCATGALRTMRQLREPFRPTRLPRGVIDCSYEAETERSLRDVVAWLCHVASSPGGRDAFREAVRCSYAAWTSEVPPYDQVLHAWRNSVRPFLPPDERWLSGNEEATRRRGYPRRPRGRRHAMDGRGSASLASPYKLIFP